MSGGSEPVKLAGADQWGLDVGFIRIRLLLGGLTALALTIGAVIAAR